MEVPVKQEVDGSIQYNSLCVDVFGIKQEELPIEYDPSDQHDELYDDIKAEELNADQAVLHHKSAADSKSPVAPDDAQVHADTQRNRPVYHSEKKNIVSAPTLKIKHTSTLVNLKKKIILGDETFYAEKKAFACDQCSCTYSRKSSLITHKRKHVLEKPFKCNQCDFKSYRRSCLNIHKATHSDLRPFACELCGNEYRQKSHLISHRLIHTGEKPIKCDLCEYMCARNSELNRHKKTHNGKETLACDKCSYTSTRKPDLFLHKQKHIKDNFLKVNRASYRQYSGKKN